VRAFFSFPIAKRDETHDMSRKLGLFSRTQHLSSSHEILMRHINNTFSALTHEANTIIRSLKTLSSQHAPIYTSIVREFTAIERSHTTRGRVLVDWTTARVRSYSRWWARMKRRRAGMSRGSVWSVLRSGGDWWVYEWD